MGECKVYFGKVKGKKGLRVLVDGQELTPSPFNQRKFESIEITIKDHPPGAVITSWLGVTVIADRR